MSTTPNAAAARLFVILNPASGNSRPEEVSQALAGPLNCEDGTCVVHPLMETDDLAGLARQAAESGTEVVVAAGGDGTVSAVASALVGTRARLGILPLGTGNILARELGIPIDLQGAIALLAGPHGERSLDAMKVGDRYFFTQLGVGIDALMIRDTQTEAKKRFGRLAYTWTLLSGLAGWAPQRYRLTIDGRQIRRRASQVLLANSGTLGQKPFTWGPGIRLDDGRINVMIVRGRHLFDYLGLALNFLLRRHGEDRRVAYFVAERGVTIETRRPMPVQADGEIIGQTPVQVEVVAGALRAVVPEAAEESDPT